jgi:signal transduction histidine kinase
VFKHNPDDPKTLSNNTVNSVYIDISGAVWLGTQNGLNRLEPKTGSFTVFYEKDGLPGNAVSCILEDGRGELWISTNNGVSRFDRLKRTFRNYSTADGLPGGDLTAWGTCFRSPSGEMFFGGFAGATAFRPENVLDNTYIPPIVLTDFRLSGVTLEPGPASQLKRSIAYAEELTLSHQQDSFSVQFSALSFFSPQTNRYRYKLEGLDSSWHEVGSEQRLASYTTLPAGVYEFRVQGATSRGPWSEPGTALRIEILPPWWNTWWFRTVVAALFVLVLLAVYYYRLRQIAQQLELRLEERVGERTRIARELHDSLLQGFQGLMFRLQAVRDLLPARPSEAAQVLDAALDRGDQAIVEGRDAVQDLRSNTAVSNDLAHAVAALGEELSQAKGSEPSPGFRVLEEGKPRVMDSILRDEIYRIAREALRNAFRHACAHSIEAEISYGESQFSLRIRDSGIGIDAPVLGRGSLSGHWGLPGMRERAKKFGGTLNVWSKSGAGTEIELTIPAVTAYRAQPAAPRFWFSRKKRQSNHAPDA